MKRPSPSRAFVPGALCIALLAAGCAIAPEPIGDVEHLERAKSDSALLFVGQEPVTAPLTIEEATARALRYNYDHRLALTEAALQTAQFDLAVMNTLPRLAADAGYNVRDSENASSSMSILSRKQSLEPSTSQDMNRATSDLSFSWNLLDFGVGYYQARQQGDRALIAVERRRRVINNIVKEVRTAYWRAATAQRLLPKIDPLLKRAQSALAANADIERASLEAVLPTLEFHKNLLQVIGQLKRLRSELSVSKAQLAALINVPQGTAFTIAEPETPPMPPRSFKADLGTLEMLGLSMRPELREEAYQERVDRSNLRKEIIRMMPGLSLLGTLNYDSNSYLTNNLWAEAGVKVTYNLVNLIQAPRAISAAETQIEVAKARRLALSVAVLTQVNVGWQQYMRAIESYDDARQVAEIEAKIAKTVNNGGLAEAEPEFERIRRDLTAVAAELDRDRSYTDLQASFGNLYTAVGVDPVPAGVDTNNLNELRKAVHGSFARLDKGELPDLPKAPEGNAATPAPATAIEEAKPEIRPAPVATAPTAPVPASPVPIASSTVAGWRVQLGVIPADAVDAEWNRLQSRYGDALANATRDVKTLNGASARVRLLAAGLDETGARGLCERVAAAHGACLVLRPETRTEGSPS